MTNYPIRKQRRISIACYIVHNFIRIKSRNDRIFNEYLVKDLDVIDEESSRVREEAVNIDLGQENISHMSTVKDHFAGAMWLDYLHNQSE